MVDGNGSNRTDKKLADPTLIAVITALLAWAFCLAYMGREARDASEVFWSRLALLFASVDAVAFAAGGALWGASIQRERTKKAVTATARNQADAENGSELGKIPIADAPDEASPARSRAA